MRTLYPPGHHGHPVEATVISFGATGTPGLAMDLVIAATGRLGHHLGAG